MQLETPQTIKVELLATVSPLNPTSRPRVEAFLPLLEFHMVDDGLADAYALLDTSFDCHPEVNAAIETGDGRFVCRREKRGKRPRRERRYQSMIDIRRIRERFHAKQ